MSQQTRLWAVLGVLGLLAGIILVVMHDRPVRTSPEPGNSEKKVPFDAFVGSDRCAECHDDIASRYRRTGHADTFARTSDSDWARRLDGASFEDAERNRTFHYHFDEETGLSVTLPEEFGEKQFPLAYALGSNQHALTFLQLMPDPTGETLGVEHRVSVYGPDGRLGLTPSHAGSASVNLFELFGTVNPQATVEACVGCHTTHFDLKDHQLVDLIENVGCESCHGPGARHVLNMNEGLSVTAIDALRDDTPPAALHQIESCGACHRSPRDLKPSDITPGNDALARFQPVGLMQSECFKQSRGNLSCTTCHNPHDRPSGQSVEIVKKCIECHRSDRTGSTACPVSPQANCIECHMPPVEVHDGIFFHDHWIRARTGPP